jgi:8-amino-7-oxononanoate synthase
MRPADVQEAGLYVYFEAFEDREGCAPGEVRIQGRKILMFGSNDYLDLTTHPKVKEAAIQALRRYGTSCSGARILNGTLDLHIRLESELATLMRKEAALIFGTGFQTNYAVLSALARKGDVLVCDHNLHASLVEGTLQSTARTVRFRHNDMGHLERCLRHCSPEERILIVSEGVFSMEGDLANLPETVALAKRHGTRVYVDEAHGIGVLGPTGAGAAEHFGVLDDVDVVMGTFSKSLASIGGFVASNRAVIDYLKHNASAFIFSVSSAPAAVAAAGAALEIIRQEPERRQRLQHIADLLRQELRSRGFAVLDGHTPIVPVVVEDELEVFQACKRLLQDGIYVNPVLRPASAHNILRISCTAAHTETQVCRLVEGLRKAICQPVPAS